MQWSKNITKLPLVGFQVCWGLDDIRAVLSEIVDDARSALISCCVKTDLSVS